ncbi:unnamed protein product [Urochloa decumbens]|uniref:DUF4220 domain-containing protein n=1 Tax=Urochloa decumbens TaxID=240449 RepID=A0ABC9E2G0_9POAL
MYRTAHTHRAEMAAGYGQKLVQLWNDWQLSAAVLLSLSLHLLLLSTGGLRRRMPPSSWKKAYFWALYMGSRFVAPYALGILSRASRGNADADIQAFWAAFLLFHLGGVDDFTALSLEDNKLWVRRGFEMAINVVTTGYVFFRYFLDPAFRRLIVPFALIYLAGAVKYMEQVVALQRATMEALIDSVLGVPDAGPDYADFMDRVDGILRSGVLPSFTIGNESVVVVTAGGAADPPKAGDTCPVPTTEQQASWETIASARALFQRFKVLFADGIFSFKDRRYGQDMFANLDASRAFRVIEMELSFVYDRLYTKASVSRTKAGLLIRVASLLLTLADSLYALLATSSSEYRLRHRCVTYTLLAGAVLTDTVLLVARVSDVWSLLGSKWVMMKRCSVKLVNRRRWSGCMAQSNLITFCLQELPSESKLLAFLRQPRRSAVAYGGPLIPVVTPAATSTAHIGSLLVQELLESDGSSFQEILPRKAISDRSDKVKKLLEALQATEARSSTFIFRQLKKKESQFNDWELERREKARALMLSSTTTMAIKRCRDTCAEARRHFLKKHVEAKARSLANSASRKNGGTGKAEEAVSEEMSAHVSLLKVVEVTPLQASVVKGDKSKSVLWDGCFLAKELDDIMGADPARKWRVIAEVWVEMLCYAAVHCGGYQHAERLKEGGELLTLVCLLMTHLGMGKHYRTEIGDAYPHLSAYTA